MDDYPEALKVLGVERGASEQEIRRAYFHLVRKFPPESNPQAFQKIRQAYMLVKDADRKAEFELSDLELPPPPEAPAGLEPLKPGDIHLEPDFLLTDEKVGMDGMCDDILKKTGSARRKRGRRAARIENSGQQTLF